MEELIKILDKIFPNGIPISYLLAVLMVALVYFVHNGYLKHQSSISKIKLNTAEEKLKNEQRKSLELDNLKKERELNESTLIINKNQINQLLLKAE